MNNSNKSLMIWEALILAGFDHMYLINDRFTECR